MDSIGQLWASSNEENAGQDRVAYASRCFSGCAGLQGLHEPRSRTGIRTWLSVWVWSQSRSNRRATKLVASLAGLANAINNKRARWTCLWWWCNAGFEAPVTAFLEMMARDDCPDQ